MITIEHVTHRYGEVTALLDVSLTVDAGETIALMGGNGAGKTTLLRLIAELDEPDAGTIDSDGVVGFAPADPTAGLFADTVAAEVAFFPRNRGIEAEDRALAAMRALDVEHLAERGPHTLSKGEQRRVSIAAVLAGDPAVVALDEPSVGLDRLATGQLLAALDGLDAAIVLTTHDADVALAAADRVAILDDGGLDSVGPAGERLADDDTLVAAGIRPPAALAWAREHGVEPVPTSPREAAEGLEGAR